MAEHRVTCKECNGKGSIEIVVCHKCEKPLNELLVGAGIDDFERKLCSACWEKDDIEKGEANFARRPMSLPHILSKLKVLGVEQVKLWKGVSRTDDGGPWNQRIKKAESLPVMFMSLLYERGAQIDTIVLKHRETWPAELWWMHPDGSGGLRNFQVHVFADDIPEAFAEYQKINTGNGSSDAYSAKLDELEKQAEAYLEELRFQAKEEIAQLSLNIEKMRNQRTHTIYKLARDGGLVLEVDDNGFLP